MRSIKTLRTVQVVRTYVLCMDSVPYCRRTHCVTILRNKFSATCIRYANCAYYCGLDRITSVKAVVRTRKNGYSDYKLQGYKKCSTKIAGTEPLALAASLYTCTCMDSNLRLCTYSSTLVAISDNSTLTSSIFQVT